jgi:hypothetical protein
MFSIRHRDLKIDDSFVRVTPKHTLCHLFIDRQLVSFAGSQNGSFLGRHLVFLMIGAIIAQLVIFIVTV